MEGLTEKLLDILIGLVIFFALLGVIVTATGTIAWATLNIGGTVYNLAWAPYIIVLVIVVAVVVLTYRYMLKKGHK